MISLSNQVMLADGMGGPGMSWQSALVMFGCLIALVSGVARWLGAARWLACAIPVLPLLVWFLYSILTNAWIAGQGGAVPWCIIIGPMLVIAFVISAVTVLIIPKRRKKPSA